MGEQVQATAPGAPGGNPPPYTQAPHTSSSFGHEWVRYAVDALLSQGSARYLTLAFTNPTMRIASFALQLFSAFNMIKVLENEYESMFGPMGTDAAYYIGTTLLAGGIGAGLLAKSPLAIAVAVVAAFEFSQVSTNQQ